MKCHGASAVFIALLLSTGLEVRAEDRTIYGADDRLEFYEVPENFRTAAAATVSLWKKPKLEQDPVSGKYNLLTVNFGDSYYLCPEVRFREQPIGAFCSGELVGEDLVLTAGHCIITQSDCDATAVVFGYAINAPGKNARTQMDVGDIYSCSGIIKRKQQDTTVTTDNNPQLIYGPDYALIRLDRKVAGRKPVPVNRLGGLKKGDKVFAVGHPVGLPFKFTANGLVVKEVQPDAAYFVTNLDSFGGNSGAA
ncbi:MAG: serine protease, partial [Elusimicrobiales bacterium]